MRPQAALSFMVLMGAVAAPLRAADDDHGARWWPVQARPAALVRTGHPRAFPEPQLAYQMLVQSVAGLAAEAGNEGRGEEMGGVGTGTPDAEAWYAALIARPAPAGPVLRGEYAPWELVDRYAKRG